MAIIEKYYDTKGKLRVVKDKEVNKINIMRFKKLKNGKEFPCCDFKGDCNNIAYAEVYPFIMKNCKKKGWSYLCKKHYFEEQKRLNRKLPACLKIEY